MRPCSWNGILCAWAVAILLLPSGTNSAAAPAPPASLKFHPGHYIALDKGQGQDGIRDAKKPGVVGVQKRYAWSELESDKDHYDFSTVDADLTLAAKLGLQFVMFVEDKSFTEAKPTPAYLADKTVPLQGSGWVAKRWDPEVVDRFSRLLKAIGSHFDGHPNFEGVAIQETSLGFPTDQNAAYGYKPEAYRDALITLLKNARDSLPTSQVFWYMNFLEGRNAYLSDVADAIVPYRIAMGGPDVMPDNPALQRQAYPLYERLAGKLTLFCSVQNKEYALRRGGPNHADGKFWTMEELFEFARDRLHVSYLFWNRKNWRKPPGSYDWTDALAVIRDHPTFNQK